MKTALLLLLLVIVSEISFSAEISGRMKIKSIDARDSGSQALYFTGTVPSQGCTHEDRAIITKTGSEGTADILSLATVALINYRDVSIQVDGCAFLAPPNSSATSPKITRLTIYK